MAGNKETYEIELHPDQMAFVSSMKAEYKIPNDSKVVRVMIDYLLENRDIYDTVFNKSRCLRCE